MKNQHVAVSNNYGDIMIYDYKDFQVLIQTLLEPQEWCEVLKYSPSETHLAVGSHDNSIYVYEVSTPGGSSSRATY
jgi:WD40 repeat protein